MSHTKVRIEDKQFWITSTYDPSISTYGVLRKEGWCVYGVARYKITSLKQLEYALSLALSDLKANLHKPRVGPTLAGILFRHG